MHAVATKAVAGTVTGLPIRRVPRAKTDEAESAFALVVHGSSPRPSVSALVSLHGIAFASHLQSHHLMLSIINHFAISFFFSQVKPSPTCICTFTHSSIQHTPFLSLSILPSIGLFFSSFPLCPPAPDTLPSSPSPSGLTTFYDTAALFILISKIGLGTVWTG